MDFSKIDSSLISFSTAHKEVKSQVKDNWTENGINFLLYSIPVVGTVIKVVDWGFRCFQGSSKMIANSKIDLQENLRIKPSKEQVVEHIREKTRSRQASDLMFVVATAVSFVVFPVFSISATVSAVVSITGVTFWSSLMSLQAQQVYKSVLKTNIE